MKIFAGLLIILAGVLSMETAMAAGTIHIVAFGGSNTYGKNLARKDAYPAQLEALLRSEGYDVQVKNEGINGNTTADELRRLDSDIPPGTDIVIFQPGGNDKKKMVAGTQQNIETIVQRLLDRNIEIIFSGNIKKQEYARKFNVLLIDEIKDLADDELQSDGAHLTPRGYRIVAEKMLPLVKELIAKIRH